MITKTDTRKEILLCLSITLVLLISLTTPAWAQGADQPSAAIDRSLLFQQANHFYEHGEFMKAAKTYLQLDTAGYESGNLYFNLGNTYFKMGQKGRAILYYEKAHYLIPNDPLLKTNLDIALTSVNEGEINWRHEFFRSLAFLAPLDQLTLTSAVCFYLFILLLIILVLIPNLIRDKETAKIKTWYRSILISCSCLLFLLVSLTTLTYLDRFQVHAVAIKDSTPVFSEPNPGGMIYFHLVEGSRILVNQTKGEWCLIKRQDGKRGWVEQHNLERI
jgi:Tetratricopeptide repeat/Bacterial SH3 domain